MAKNDWYEAGEQIVKLVQAAVDSKDFSQLGTTISDVVNDTVNGLQSALKENISVTVQDGLQKTARSAYEYTNRAAAEQIRHNVEEKRRRQEAEQAKKAVVPVKTSMSVPGEFTAKLTKWFGYGMSGILGISLGIVVLVGATTGLNFIVPTAILAMMTGISYGIGARGRDRVGMAQRFRRYKEMVGDRKFCLIEELASAIGKSSKFVRKDLRRMIEKGFFKEGYLDREQKMLITDKATYQQYLTTQTEYERKKLEGKADSQKDSDGRKEGNAGAAKTADKLSPECRELVAEGQRYIQHVHACNEKIEDADMSAKLDRLELVITRIFRVAEQDPEVVGDLKKMMSYYLPTTRKLLDAYCEMAEQPIQGENIRTTQKEIESALDTINVAFENLLDSFFKDTAWDISSDITVLNTMLAQEGLTGKAFSRDASKDRA